MAFYLEAYLTEVLENPLETPNIFGTRKKLPSYDCVREVLRPEYRNLSDAQIPALLDQVLGGMSPEEVEGFWDTLKDVGKAALGVAQQVAPAVLPMAGGALGTFIGGPVGTAIGSKLGQMGAQLLTKQPASAPAPPQPTTAASGSIQQPPAAAPAPTAPTAPVPPGGTSATAQLMTLLKNPDLLKSLLGQLLGKAGESTVLVGPEATPIRFGAMMNALESLAAQAAIEAADTNGDEVNVEAMAYLQDGSGNYIVDPANPDERAQRVIALLNEATQDYVPGPYDPVTEWLIDAELFY